MKTCPKCQVEVTNPRKKFCSDGCKYWYNLIRKEKEACMPPFRKRNRNFFSMITGSEVAKMSGSRQGRRSGGMITGGMSARIEVTTEVWAPVTKENLDRHFKGVKSYIPTGIKLGDNNWLKKEEIESEFKIKI